MKTAATFIVVLSFIAVGCDENDNQPAATGEGSGGAAQVETTPTPAADKLEFFGYWIGMPWDEFLDRAKKVHGFTLKAGEGRGRIEGVEVEGRFSALDGKLAEFHVFHTTTEPVPMPDMAFHKVLTASVGRAEGGCSGEPADMHCQWKAGGASLTLSKTEGWPKGAPAMEHEYKVYAAIDEPAADPTAEDLARRESETAQKKRAEVIEQAIVIANQIQLTSKGQLKPTANDCLWRLHNDDPETALKVAQCMIKAEVYNDLRACYDPCRPPDPSLSK